MTISINDVFLICMICGVLSSILTLTLFQYYGGPTTQTKKNVLSMTSYCIIAGLLIWGAWNLWGDDMLGGLGIGGAVLVLIVVGGAILDSLPKSE